MFDLKDLIRRNIRDLIPYSSARNEYSGMEAILMDANESPYNGPFNRYPDPGQEKLKLRLAEILDVLPGKIFLGNGSDEAIDLLIRIFCVPGRDRIIIMDPSYGMYKVCADINDVACDFVELDPDFSLNADRILSTVKSTTKMVFLCSPNNPTSNLLEPVEIRKVLEGFGGMVILDEAYIDFTGGNGLIPYLDQYANLVLLRTLSKAWAAAGIRLGMALADERVCEILNRVKYPYNINVLTQEKALELLSKEKQKQEWIDLILAERERLTEELVNLDIIKTVYHSDANFLLVRTDDPDLVYDTLQHGGIIVRNRSHMTHCEGCLRITIGTRAENKRLIEILKTF